MEFNRVTEHFEQLDKLRWSSEEAVTHVVQDLRTTACGIPIGNYQSGWMWGERLDSNHCPKCFKEDHDDSA